MKTIIRTAAEVMVAIPILSASLRANEQEIHELAVSTLDHAREHGDYRGVLALMNALNKGTRTEALALWYRHFSNNKLTVTREKNGAWTVGIKTGRQDSDFDIVGADATTFADFSKEPVPKQMTLEALLRQVRKIANDTTTLPNGARKVPESVADAAVNMLRAVGG